MGTQAVLASGGCAPVAAGGGNRGRPGRCHPSVVRSSAQNEITDLNLNLAASCGGLQALARGLLAATRARENKALPENRDAPAREVQPTASTIVADACWQPIAKTNDSKGFYDVYH